MNIKARQTKMTIGPQAGKILFVMQTDIYNRLKDDKVISEAGIRSGLPKGTLRAAWEAIGEVISAWLTEGHSVAIPGLGSVRCGINANAVENMEEVKSSLITARKIILAPSTDIKVALEEMPIEITCYDIDGKIIKKVTSNDSGTVDDGEEDTNGTDPDNSGSGNDNQGGSSSGGSGTGDDEVEQL